MKSQSQTHNSGRFTILTTHHAQVSGAKKSHIVVQPSPLSPELFWQNGDSVPIKHSLHPLP